MFAEEIARYLAEQGVGTVGVNLFAGGMPDQPDEALAVIPYYGRQPQLERGATPDVGIEYPRAQILARANHPRRALELAERPYRVLARLANRRLSGTWYVGVVPLQSPYSVGRDEAGRYLAGFNIEAMKGPSDE